MATENNFIPSSEIVSDYIVILLNHLDKLSDLSPIDEIIDYLQHCPEGLKIYSKVFEDCKSFYTDNKRFLDIDYLVSLHNIIVFKKDCPFSLDILLKLKKELSKFKQLSQVSKALEEGDLSTIRTVVSNNTTLEIKKLLGAEDIVDVYAKQELSPKGVFLEIPEIDYYLKGYDYGSLNVIGAPVASFKTTLAISTAYTACMKGKKVLFITLEVVPKNVLYNIMSRHSYEMYGRAGAIPSVSLKKSLLTDEQKQKLTEVKDDFLKTKLGDIRIAGVDDLEEYSMEYIEAFILRMRDEMDGLDMVYVDYLNLFKNKIPPKLKLDQYQALNYYVDTLQQIAIKHNLIVILLCQLKSDAIDKLNTDMEKSDKKGTPSGEVRLASSTYFAEANALGRTSMTAIILHTTPAMKNNGKLNIHIVKNRDFEQPERPIQTVVMPDYFVVGTRGNDYTECSVLSDDFNKSSNQVKSVDMLADDLIVQGVDDYELNMDTNK